jgi:RHS repeat-associated protein
MDGLNVESSIPLLGSADFDWQIEGSPDLNADGKPDILWRNYVTGENYVWYMNGTVMTGGAHLATEADTNWRIANMATAAELVEQIYYFHNDHLGTPQVVTDNNGTKVWEAEYDPFGKADVTLATVTNNIRFPGQYYDGETDLHYNYFRTYDPATGRYLEADPIGIGQGRNHLYSYAANNPVNFIDPLGLEDISVSDGDWADISTCGDEGCLKQARKEFLDCAFGKEIGIAQGACLAACATACSPTIGGGGPVTYGTCFWKCSIGCGVGSNVPRSVCFTKWLIDREKCFE